MRANECHHSPRDHPKPQVHAWSSSTLHLGPEYIILSHKTTQGYSSAQTSSRLPSPGLILETGVPRKTGAMHTFMSILMFEAAKHTQRSDKPQYQPAAWHRPLPMQRSRLC